MRALLLTPVLLALLPASLARPWIGVLGWTWLGLMNPHRLTWGVLTQVPWAMLVAILTLVGFVFARDRRPLPNVREVWLLLAFWFVCLLSTLGAEYPNDAWDQLTKVSKIFFMTLIMLCLLQEERKVRALIWVLALSVGFFGIKGGIFSIVTGGQHQVLGPEGGFLEGNTEIALGLNMTIPLLLFLQHQATRRWHRNLFRFAIGLS